MMMLLGSVYTQAEGLCYIPFGKDGFGYLLVNGFGLPLHCEPIYDSRETRYWFGDSEVTFDTYKDDFLLMWSLVEVDEDDCEDDDPDCVLYHPVNEYAEDEDDEDGDSQECNLYHFQLMTREGWIAVDCRVQFDFEKGKYRMWALLEEKCWDSGWLSLAQPVQMAKRVLLRS